MQNKKEAVSNDVKLLAILAAVCVYETGAIWLSEVMYLSGVDRGERTSIAYSAMPILGGAAALASVGIFRRAQRHLDELVKAHEDIDQSYKAV